MPSMDDTERGDGGQERQAQPEQQAPADGAPANTSADSSLLGFIGAVAGESHVRVEENLGGGFVRLRVSEAERRQAKHDIRSVEDVAIELLRNSRDAHAKSIFFATGREGAMRSMVVIDSGDGIPAAMHEAIFEPRVTSKLDTMRMDRWGVHGRGMALFSIKENVEVARVASSEVGLGSAIEVVVDTESLPEITDQSSAPELGRGADGALLVARGPHNINRQVAEFSLDNRHDVDVYLGSHAEVAATLVDFGEKESDARELLFNDSPESLPVCHRLASCGSAAELMERCSTLGLRVSERTAYRILHGQIAPLRPYVKALQAKSREQHRRPADIFKDSRALKISKEDLSAFSRKLEAAFDDIAAQYYVELLDEPKITVGRDNVKVVFSIEKN